MQTHIETINIDKFNVIETLYIWDESIALNQPSVKYSMYGTGTYEIPEFHKLNMAHVAANTSVNDYQYPDMKGHASVLETIAKNMKKYYHRDIDPTENVIVADGANRSITSIIQAHAEDGDEVLFFEPFYTSHINDMNIGKNLKIRLCPFDIVDYKETKQFKFNVDNFRKAMNENVKMVMIISPHNPTGYVFSQEDLEEMSKVLEDYPKTIVIEDNSYFIYLEDGVKLNFFSSIGNNFEKSYNVFSGGKLFNIHGLRVGWTISSKNNIQAFYEARYKSFNFVSSLEQFALAKDLDDMNTEYNDGKDYPTFAKDRVNESVSKLSQILIKHDILPLRMMGTYYLIADISKIVNKLPKEYFVNTKTGNYEENPDKAFCRILLKEYRIGMVPLSAMTCNYSDYATMVRISANRKDEDMRLIDEALTEILK